MTIHNIGFFGFLSVFLASILGIGTHYYLRSRRRELYPYGKWEELLKRLAPLDHQNIERIAADPAAQLDQDIHSVEAMSPQDIWRLLGGMRGIEVMEKNCSVLVDLVFLRPAMVSGGSTHRRATSVERAGGWSGTSAVSKRPRGPDVRRQPRQNTSTRR